MCVNCRWVCGHCGATSNLISQQYEIDDGYFGGSYSHTNYYCADQVGCEERHRRNKAADDVMREAKKKADSIRRGEVK